VTEEAGVEWETVSREELRDGDEVRLVTVGTWSRLDSWIHRGCAGVVTIETIERRVKQPSEKALRAASRLLDVIDPDAVVWDRSRRGGNRLDAMARIIDKEMG